MTGIRRRAAGIGPLPSARRPGGRHLAKLACLAAAGCSALTAAGCAGASSKTAASGSTPSTAVQSPSPTSTTPVGPAARPSGAEAVASGISDISQAPFPSTDFTVSNQYHGLYNGQWISIYAGQLMRPGPARNQVPTVQAASAGIRVFSGPNPYVDSSRRTSYVGQFLIPGAAQSASIVSVAGSQVVLQGSKGARFVFDLGSRQLTPDNG